MKRILVLAIALASFTFAANSQTVSSFAGKVNTSPTTDFSNSTADLAAAYFYYPSGIAWDASGNMYVAEANKIRLITGSKVYNRSGQLGDPSTSLSYKNGTGNAAGYFSPAGVVCDSDGNAYICDEQNHAIRKLNKFQNIGNGQSVSTFAGANPDGSFQGTSGYKDGSGTNARFNSPKGITIDAAGNLYVTDNWNDCIRKISPSGSVITLAGLGETNGNTDGTGSTARFNAPYGVAMLDATHIVVSDFGNSSIRKININSGLVTTICGGFGTKDGSLAEARFRAPRGIAVVDGLIYVADNTTIRVIDVANNTVSTFAGSSSASGNTDGTGTDARFGVLYELAYDGAASLYVTDATHHIIKKVSIDNLAPVADFSTTKKNLAINEETTLSDISSGKQATKRTWLVENTSGSTSNVVLVQGDYNSSKDITVKFTATGSYRVTLTVTNEFGTDNVTKTNITVSTTGSVSNANLPLLTVYPNPATTNLVNLKLENTSFSNASLSVISMTGAEVYQDQISATGDYKLNVSTWPKGIYNLILQSEVGIVSKKLIIQ